MLERAGADAIQIEDQVFPKRCGHFDGKETIPKAEMVAKVKAAADARTDLDLIIVARTDAIATDGFEAALDRAAAYHDAGADVTFIEAPQTEQQIVAIGKLAWPQIINIVLGGRTPEYPNEKLKELGFAGVLYANVALQASIRGMQLALGTLRENGAIGDASLLAVDFCRAPAPGRQTGLGRAREKVQNLALAEHMLLRLRWQFGLIPFYSRVAAGPAGFPAIGFHGVQNQLARASWRAGRRHVAAADHFRGRHRLSNHVEKREEAFDRVMQLVRSTRLILDSEVKAMTAGLQVLALSAALQRDDFEQFRRNAESFLTQFPENQSIVIADRDGRLVFDTRTAPGTVLPVRTTRVGTGEVFKTRRPAYSPLFAGSISKELIITITVPVFRNGEVIYDLSFNPSLAEFQRIIERQRPNEHWTFSFFDQNGVNFARVPNPEKTIGQSASPTLFAEMFKAPEAKVRTVSLEGVPLLTAFARSDVRAGPLLPASRKRH